MCEYDPMKGWFVNRGVPLPCRVWSRMYMETRQRNAYIRVRTFVHDTHGNMSMYCSQNNWDTCSLATARGMILTEYCRYNNVESVLCGDSSTVCDENLSTHDRHGVACCRDSIHTVLLQALSTILMGKCRSIAAIIICVGPPRRQQYCAR